MGLLVGGMLLAESVFKRIDGMTGNFHGFSLSAILWNVTNWRKYFAFCAFVGGMAWILFGWDSTWSQATPYIDYFTQVFISNPVGALRAGIPFARLWQESRVFYGIGNHFSAPVIYGLAFVALSLYFERVGITKSLNFCATTALSLFSVGVFEVMWNSFYALFHGQVWAVTFQWKQVTNLLAFIGFITIGLLVFVYLALEGYRPNLGKRSLALFLLTVVCWGFWINYPFAVGHVTVDTNVGPWTNGDMFPQTYYAVDIDNSDGLAIGVPHYVQNDTIHFVNTLTKVVQTLFVLSVSMVRKRGVG